MQRAVPRARGGGAAGRGGARGGRDAGLPGGRDQRAHALAAGLGGGVGPPHAGPRQAVCITCYNTRSVK